MLARLMTHVPVTGPKAPGVICTRMLLLLDLVQGLQHLLRVAVVESLRHYCDRVMSVDERSDWWGPGVGGLRCDQSGGCQANILQVGCGRSQGGEGCGYWVSPKPPKLSWIEC